MRHSHLVACLAAILTSGPPSLAYAETWIVDVEGGGDFLGIQAALDVAEDGDVVEVLRGTYEGSLDTLGKSLVLVGVDGSGSTSLLGTGVNPALRIEGGEAVEVRGFHISGGNTLANPEYVAGGLHAEETELILSDLVVAENTAFVGGGAIFFQSHVTMTDVRFSGNFATATASGDWGQGGAVYGYQSDAVFSDLVVSQNSAQHGGGIMWVEGQFDLSDSLIADNASEGSGGGLYLKDVVGGALVDGVELSDNLAEFGGGLRGRETSLVISNSLLVGNRATSGGAARLDAGSYLSLQDSTLSSNQADYGGGLLLQNSTGNLARTSLEDNEATLLGGGVYLADSDLEMSLVAFLGNTAVSDGGGLRAEGSSVVTASNGVFAHNSGSNGGAVHLYNGAQAHLEHLTFAGNSATSGGTLRVTDTSSLTLRNSILAWPTQGSGLSASSSPTLLLEWNNLYAPDTTAVSGGVGDPTGDSGNISGDPRFLALTEAYDASNRDDLRLGPSSASIDTADPAAPVESDGTRADQGSFGGALGVEFEGWWTSEPSGDDDDSAGPGDDDDSGPAGPPGEWQNNVECACGARGAVGSGAVWPWALLLGLIGLRRARHPRLGTCPAPP
jgi:predicted outer membrane repeat protein